MRLTFYGRLSHLAEGDSIELAVPAEVGTVADLRRWLGEKKSALGEALLSPRVRAVVDGQFAADDYAIAGAGEIGFLPPVSGG